MNVKQFKGYWMMSSSMESRSTCYYELSSYLSQFSNESLLKLIKSSPFSQGWGINHQIEIDARPLFVKRIPLTSIEYQQMFSTKNHYRLPNYYHYGVGSAGFGAFRELICHIKTTNWVLKGEVESFPLLYHYRVLHSQASWKQRKSDSLEKYLNFWNNNQRIANYIQERQNTPYEIALFLEYIPYSLHTWFEQRPLKKFDSFIQESQESLAFLQTKGILHLDAHFANILTNGKQVFISDFGLALDKHFELGKREQDFFSRHQNYDQGELLSCGGGLIIGYYQALSGKEQAAIRRYLELDETVSSYQLASGLMHNIEHLQASKMLKVEPEFYQWLIKYRGVIGFMADFYHRLRENPKKNTSFDALALDRLLKF